MLFLCTFVGNGGMLSAMNGVLIAESSSWGIPARRQGIVGGNSDAGQRSLIDGACLVKHNDLK